MENNNMKGFNEQAVSQVCESASKSKGGLVTGLVLGGLGLLGGLAGAMIYKKKRNKNEVEEQFVESDTENVEQ